MNQGLINMVCFLVFMNTFGGLSVGKMVLLISATAVIFLGFLYKYQESLLYQPKAMPQFVTPSQNPPGFRSPAEHGMAFDNVYLEAEDGIKLHAWFVKQPEPLKCPTVVFFHANAANMGFRLTNIKQLYEDVGVNVFILSYRGYGESQGVPGEEGILLDAEAVWKYVQAHPLIDKSSILVFGRSLGGAVATYLASRHSEEIAGLMLENTFTCISDMVNKLFPFLKYVKRWVLRLDWPSVERIVTVTAPILFLSGTQDEVVPNWHMQALHDAAPNARSRTLATFAAGKHNDTWLQGGDEYVLRVRAFVETVTGTKLLPLPSPTASSIMALNPAINPQAGLSAPVRP